MATINGYLDKIGHPHFIFEVYGIGPQHKVSIDAMFDSGFSGFLNLPLAHCLRTGLILFSTSTYTLADGKPSSTLLCLGTILFDDPSRVIGAISIDFNTSESLLGIEFLKKINGKLIIDTANKLVSIEYETAFLHTKAPVVSVATSPSVSASPSSSASPSPSPSPSAPDTNTTS